MSEKDIERYIMISAGEMGVPVFSARLRRDILHLVHLATGKVQDDLTEKDLKAFELVWHLMIQLQINEDRVNDSGRDTSDQ